jgi:hypothetical protein
MITTGGVSALIGAPLGDRDLEVRQHLEQVGLERLVGTVQFVDQQHRRHRVRQQRPQQRPLDQEAAGEQPLGERLARGFLGLGQPDLQHLPRVVPLVGGGVDVQPLVALQPDQLGIQPRRQHLGDLGLAGAGLAFEEQRALQLQRQEDRGGELAVGDVVLLGKQRGGGVDRGRQGSCGDVSGSADAKAPMRRGHVELEHDSRRALKSSPPGHGTASATEWRGGRYGT